MGEYSIRRVLMIRRKFLKTCVALGFGCTLFPAGCWLNKGPANKKRVLVLGIDGMDPRLSHEFMRQGLLPNFTRLAKKGSMRSVVTSTPPQSPVAWSNFTVGASTYVHGIYDFIQRDPKTMLPYLSTSRVVAPDHTLNIGRWKIPMSKGKTENLREGKPFWEYLSEADIPTTIFKMPANFPCENKNVNMVSGMGTPDLRGGYGSFTLFTTAPNLFKRDITGGLIIPVAFQGQKLKTHLQGPANTLEENSPETKVPVEIWRDRKQPLVRILIQGNEFLLQQGEWSGWIELSFPMIEPFYEIKGICKLFVKSVYPDFTMYVSPINIDPADPALPVVSSQDYGEELVRDVGPFYTQGLPEDTKALSEGVLDDREYLGLAYQIIRERERLLDYELKWFSRQDTGMLFFYFSSLDQDTHMYWRTIDTHNPLYNQGLHQKYGDVIKKLYIAMDLTLGKVLDQNDIDDPDFTLMAMSDHGFAPFRRQVNVNTWLYKNGYLALSDEGNIENKGYLENVKWSRTGAYSVGINSIYLNLKGREKNGIVLDSQAKYLVSKLRQDLLKLVDPLTGKKVVSSVWVVPEREHRRHTYAPDLIVGWNRGYRNSWDSILGGFSGEVISDNLDKWSGDHCVDPNIVPAVLFTNKRVTKETPSLCDITATILEEFSILPAAEVEGKTLYTV